MTKTLVINPGEKLTEEKKHNNVKKMISRNLEGSCQRNSGIVL